MNTLNPTLTTRAATPRKGAPTMSIYKIGDAVWWRIEQTSDCWVRSKVVDWRGTERGRVYKVEWTTPGMNVARYWISEDHLQLTAPREAEFIAGCAK